MTPDELRAIVARAKKLDSTDYIDPDGVDAHDDRAALLGILKHAADNYWSCICGRKHKPECSIPLLSVLKETP